MYSTLEAKIFRGKLSSRKFSKSAVNEIKMYTLLGEILARRKFNAIGAKWQKLSN